MTPSAAPPPPPEHATVTDDDVVVGEGVALDLPAAGVGLRLLSGFLDVAATGLVLVGAVLLATVATADVDLALQTAATILATVASLLVWPVLWETASGGRSPGRFALGLRVVRDDGGPITAQHAFVRALLGVVEIWLTSGALALLTVLLHPRGKRLGDLAAGTYVVRTRVPLRWRGGPGLSPALAGWATTADVGPLPVGLGVAVREVLTRSRDLDPTSFDRVTAALAAQVAPHVSPAPPPGTRPADFLAGVLAVRRERDRARLARDADLRRRLVGR
ncbi:RDD family protein [Nocardioides bruguierae]|uniref:RDD family protein n=1 Tax=Nocardioides bruguierae TaxID=2945102 RepID=UPI0020214CF2|nr:RDD family protein [Nocardioides bruguierae]MCL8024187.1 RDD family protein [Nocardioides bruguierae]